MEPQKFEVGNVIQAYCQFHEVKSGEPVDPEYVKCVVKGPEGTSEYHYPPAGHITRVSEGKYLLEITVHKPKWYTIAWIGTGEVTAATETTFLVENGHVLR